MTKIVHDELKDLMGGENVEIKFSRKSRSYINVWFARLW